MAELISKSNADSLWVLKKASILALQICTFINISRD
jgi:hypothetical protein